MTAAYDDTVFDAPLPGDLVVYASAYNVKMSLLIGVVLSVSSDGTTAYVWWMGPGTQGLDVKNHLISDFIVVKDEAHAERLRHTRCRPVME